jgi:hypothetical protein
VTDLASEVSALRAPKTVANDDDLLTPLRNQEINVRLKINHAIIEKLSRVKSAIHRKHRGDAYLR